MYKIILWGESMSGIIFLEDGTIYKGKGFGYRGTSVGEIVFNTSMIGYDEIITDSSSVGQIITMTYPIVGNYGINKSKLDTKGLNASGLIIRDLCENPSNYQSDTSLDEFAKEIKLVGVQDIDTRSLTRKIRDAGTMKCVISNEGLSENELEKILKERELKEHFLEACKVEKTNIAGDGAKVAIIDFGGSKTIIDLLKTKNCDITIFPYDSSYEEIEAINPEGILVGDGPGNPDQGKIAIETVKKFMANEKPMFGIDLGHQIIALAADANVVKMKNGHRGGNHGVLDINTGKSYIVDQNHGFRLDENSILANDFIVTHRNLNDETVEGISHNELPIFSVQFHPQSQTSFKDTEYLFDKFINSCKGVK